MKRLFYWFYWCFCALQTVLRKKRRLILAFFCTSVIPLGFEGALESLDFTGV